MSGRPVTKSVRLRPWRRSGGLIAVVLFALSAPVAVAAVDVMERTSTYTLSFSDLTFADAATLYQVDQLWQADTVGESAAPTFTLKNEWTDLNITADSNIAYSYTFIGPAVIQESLTFIDGADLHGHRYISYRTPAVAAPQPNPDSWVSRDGARPLYTLEFLGGGTQINLGIGRPFDVEIMLPGDWSALGVSTGQVEFLGINPAWTITQFFAYDALTNSTLFAAVNDNYVNESSADVHFVLYGTSVPEPGTVAAVALGVSLFIGRSRRNRGA